jgi:predicted RNA-binding Zn-ribbon protein involved in translation (DUF1610 family)
MTPRFLRWTIPAVLLVPFWTMALATGVASHWSQWANVALVGVTAAAWAGAFLSFAHMLRPPSLSVILGSALGACRHCGGLVELVEGSASTECPYCGATLLSTSEARETLRRFARERALLVLTESHDAELENWASATRADRAFGVRGGTVPLMTAIFIVGAFALTGFFIRELLQHGTAPGATSTGWIPLALFASAAAMVGMLVKRVQRAMAAKAEFERLIGRPLRPLVGGSGATFSAEARSRISCDTPKHGSSGTLSRHG